MFILVGTRSQSEIQRANEGVEFVTEKETTYVIVITF